MAEVVWGCFSAVRRAITDDGRSPLEASGLKRHARLSAIIVSVARVEAKGARRRS